ncbi:hypothetical protein K1719_030651 [Acacia pycnantha]|nr:hypothetical protein K1719_030651 [Acacia pycnantha]
MVSKAALLIFILRILVLIASLISVALVASSHSHVLGSDIHYHFKNIITLRYVMAVAATSLVYGVVQLPFAACCVLKSKRLIPHTFEFYADKVMGMLLATGSGAGIAISRELKKVLGMGSRGDQVDEDTLYYMDPLKGLQFMKSLTDTHSIFWNKLLAASVFLLLAWLCLAFISIISHHLHHHHHNKNANPTLGTYHPPPPAARSDALQEPSPNKEEHTHVPTTIDDDVKPSSHDDVCV